MNSCTYCDANAFYRDRESGAYLCPVHARLEVTGPRGKAPRPPLTIRLATPTDLTRIAELAETFWGEVEVECFGRSYRVDTLPACVACDGDEIVGMASCAIQGDVVNLVMLNVLPQWQGRGVARELIAAVTEIARVEGAERLIVATTNDDLLALGLYQRLGFTITGVLVGRVLEHHGGIEAGFAGIPVRDEIQLELRL
ncbi:MAG: GNAT family N-acetyltransferase [Chloroflexota bacterium]|nr:GNAT family N-acetyltransferase [Chloroflexota bacterium]